jgi:hypothetical protein
MSKAHSVIGASSMHRWATCPGSVRLSADMPNTSSKYAEEGTLAHEYAAETLEFYFFGKCTPKREEVTEEMKEAVFVYIDAFSASAMIDEKSHHKVFIEERFDLSELYPNLYGTSDGIIYKKDSKVLEVWDYKHGQGIAVEVEGNEQLMYYALGALMKTKVPCAEVEMVICQPRAFHPDGPIRKWKVPVTTILDFAADLVDAAKKTEDPNAILVSGEWCRFCPAAPICPLLHATALESAKRDFSPVLPYDPAELARALSVIPAVEAWAKSVKEFAQAEAERGVVLPGYKLVPKRASRHWKHEEGDIETALLLEYGLSYLDVTKTSLKTPAQIEALLTDKEMKKKLEELVIKESSGNTLAPLSDKRKASKSSIETDFTVVTDETATKE